MRILLVFCLCCCALPLYANLWRGEGPTDPAVGDGYVQLTKNEGEIALPEPMASGGPGCAGLSPE